MTQPDVRGHRWTERAGHRCPAQRPITAASDMRGQDRGQWWRSAAIYQVYPRSFADGERRRHRRPGRHPGRTCPTCATSASTRSGSARGTRRRWPTPATTWPTTATSTRPSAPWPRRSCSSPRRTSSGSGSIVDIVPNHCSDEHPWFRRGAARRAAARPPGSCSGSATAGASDGELPPNNWQSIFGGPAWTRVAGRAVVPAPVRPGAAGLQLGQPEGARGVRGHPAVLVRPRRRRRPDRLGRRCA